MTNMGGLYQQFLQSTGVSTDTRSLAKGNVFFALKGPNFNGNTMADYAIEQGAMFVVVDEEAYARDERYILVDDGLEALQALANHHRNQFSIPLIGLTGSNGKTTTKELIKEVLSATYQVTATKGNLNNHIGVPLTLLSISKETEIAIVEMGANAPDDIRELCEIAEPTHGLVTNIGSAHIEGFGSFEGVLRTKSDLYLHLQQDGGQVFFNLEEPVFAQMLKRFPGAETYPKEIVFESANPMVAYRTDSGKVIQTNMIGSYNYMNIAAAHALGLFFDVPEAVIHKALEVYVPDNNRSQLLKQGSNTIILDAYNANPSSMKAAIDNLAGMDAKKKIAIVGDMYELGHLTEEEHANIGTQIASIDIQGFYCGDLMKDAKDADGLFFENKDELEAYLRRNQFKDTTILIKASRGMGLETIVEFIN